MILKNMCFDRGEELSIYLSPILKQETNLETLWTGLLGAIIGGLFVLLGVLLTHIYNSRLVKKERLVEEKSTVLSLKEELKVIMECYQSEFHELFEVLKEQNHLTTVYMITQDYFNIYRNNTSKLGLIKNEKLRNLFIKIHIEFYRFIENLMVYEEQYNCHCSRRIAFLTDFNPNKFKNDLLKNFDTSQLINDLRNNPEQYARKDIDKDNGVQRMMFFFENDDIEQGSLRNKSIELSDIFNKIEFLYEQIMDIVKKEYSNSNK